MYWHTIFGRIEFTEQIFLSEGKIHRPFAKRFGLHCRHYSRRLQRAVTDFGADVSFEAAAEKMKEHYRLEVPASMIRKITQEHARKIDGVKIGDLREKANAIVAEMDGGMVPIVEVGEKSQGIDLRKRRKVCWKEAKVCFAREHKTISRIYGAIIGSPEEVGIKLYECARKIGFVETTYVHGLGDGAQWIVDEMENQFGTQSHFLVDFFHMSEYLAGASSWCDASNAKGWLEEKKEMMKASKGEKVLEELKIKLSNLENNSEDNGLVKCIRYMSKRLKYMDYAGAKQKGLPIGSGEIESSHRHLVQKRLKIAGAWWKIENANAMLNLRTARANKCWEAYWNEKKAA